MISETVWLTSICWILYNLANAFFIQKNGGNMANYSIANKFVPMGLTFEDVALPENNVGNQQDKISMQTILTPTLKLNQPILSAAMDTVTESPMAIALAKFGGLGVIHKNMLIADQAAEIRFVKSAKVDLTLDPNTAVDDHGRLIVAGAVGVTSNTLERVRALVAAGADAIVLDSAHGHSEGVLRKIREVRDAFPKINIIAGNIATKEGASALYDAGADVAKVGIGPGSICTTRVVAGVGVPQISAIAAAAEAAKEYNKAIIADGGIKTSADMSKAILAGGHAIMLGSVLAGTYETPGDVLTDEATGLQFKAYRGMGSIAAMQNGSKDRYFQGEVNEANKMVPEGIEGKTPYKGTLLDVLRPALNDVAENLNKGGFTSILQAAENGHLVVATATQDYAKVPQSVRIMQNKEELV
ncbi:IMP dehydrogenase [Weissella paramesenteroides]|uniref:IMP dehydrogenase n=2 Tax=Weissella paramesenteroides TaxID=1249 RepID=A0ABD4XIN9_WEIPA|nr:IMP dehydrogenase [Weissella paramesenteroides]MDF8369105.1 IMP dehydrogenase [Weissella paramesenteroides]MDF8371100.1 IMP dehydrogenase [Weissella paramesenteroides]MDF8373411.1 IMP dehydrogenase [Weissella paramesenteroides]WIG65703.1 IMP dehydrogenase [Weissella paramesenteroides]